MIGRFLENEGKARLLRLCLRQIPRPRRLACHMANGSRWQIRDFTM